MRDHSELIANIVYMQFIPYTFYITLLIIHYTYSHIYTSEVKVSDVVRRTCCILED